jgi:hypothetical protein
MYLTIIGPILQYINKLSIIILAVTLRLTQFLKDFTQEQKIDFLFLYVESRKPTIRPESHNRHYN